MSEAEVMDGFLERRRREVEEERRRERERIAKPDPPTSNVPFADMGGFPEKWGVVMKRAILAAEKEKAEDGEAE